jgi:hypothetical protein
MIIDEALWRAVKERQATMALDTRPGARSTQKPFHQQTRPNPLRDFRDNRNRRHQKRVDRSGAVQGVCGGVSCGGQPQRIGQRTARSPVEQELARTDKRIRLILDVLTGSDDAPRSLMDDLRILEARRVEPKAASGG